MGLLYCRITGTRLEQGFLSINRHRLQNADTLRIPTRKTHPQKKKPLALLKSMNMGIWVIGTLN